MNNQAMSDATIDEILKSVNYMIQTALKNTTQSYNGLVVSSAGNNKWNVKYNGETHAIKAYGPALPTSDSMVKVIVPQGNQALAWFFVPVESGGSGDGTTFIPSVSDLGVISWTNDGGLPNPDPVNIKGPQGDAGDVGPQGPKGDVGETGPYFTPSVSQEGVISWTNNGELENPNEINIKGPQGEVGPQGPIGPEGLQGPQGVQGPIGETGPYFIPSVDNEGNLSWTNNGGLDNPSTVNIKGPQGTQGQPGIQGPPGQNGSDGADGKDGATFTPSVSSSGELSWTNDKGLPNPATVNIKGPQGNPGQDGTNGTDGENGATFTPSVNSNGDLSWTNDKGLSNPATVNIRGPQGVQGNPGPAGANGANATINGVNTLTLTATGGLTGNQRGNTYTISGANLLSAIQDIPFQNQSSSTLTTTGWTSSSGQYYKQISFSGMSSSVAPLLIPQWSSTASTQALQEKAWNSLTQVRSFNGYIRVYAPSAITTSVPFIIYY